MPSFALLALVWRLATGAVPMAASWRLTRTERRLRGVVAAHERYAADAHRSADERRLHRRLADDAREELRRLADRRAIEEWGFVPRGPEI